MLPPAEELRRARERRIAELEASTRGVPRIPVRLPVALIGLIGGLILLWMGRLDAAYFVASRDALPLGAEGSYRTAELVSNRYVEVHGVPSANGSYSREGGDTFVFVGLRDSPFVLRRPAFPAERWEPGRTPPQPNQQPFGVRGRLLVDTDAEKYRAAFDRLRATGEVQPVQDHLWLIVSGERPGSDMGFALVTLFLGAFTLANAVLLVRALLERLRMPRSG